MQWIFLPKKSDDLKSVSSQAPLIEQLLVNRGLITEKDKQNFLHPSLEDFTKDLQIPNIKKAQQRINKAIQDQELIIIYGDYDVDGMCASAVLYHALSELGAKVLPYIPHREKEGYGLSSIGLDHARDSGASVVITVDNGIVALNQALYAKKLGLDLIITDHHLPKEELPDAFVIVHSTKMCGTSVAWCLIRGLVSKRLADELLQFVAIATVCDMMTLVGINRPFLVEGLKILNNPQTLNLGIRSLIEECGLGLKTIGAYEIGFMLGPRLNAIGRLEHAIDGLRLLCTKDPIKAKKLALLLCETNSKRQDLTEVAVEEAKLKIGNDLKKIYILDSASWQSGIIGLIAARVSESYTRPAIAISVGQTVSKGSARSRDGINIVEMIRQCSDLLIDVGGHSGAAGFSLETQNIDLFRKRMESLAKDWSEKVEKVLEVEAEVESKKLTKKLAEEIEKLAPFGFGNSQPILASINMELSDLKTLSEGKHLKGKADGLDFIAFGMGNLKDLLQNGQLINMAYNLEINKFNGSETLQLKVKDINIS